MRAKVLAALAALAFAWRTAAAQQILGGFAGPDTYVSVYGDVRLAGDGRLEHVGPGGYLRVVRITPQGASRQLEIAALADGTERRELRVNGVPRPFTEADDSLLRVVARTRSAGVLSTYATARRLQAAGDMAAVLAWVASDSSGIGYVYRYQALLDDPTLTGPQAEQVLRAVRGSVSPREWAGALGRMAGMASELDPAVQAAIVSQVMALPADTSNIRLIESVPDRFTLDDPAVAGAFYRAPRDTQLALPRHVLPFVVAQDAGLPASYLAGAIAEAGGLAEEDRVRLLLTVPSACLRSPTLRAAYSRAAGRVAYEMDRLRLLDRLNLPAVAAARGTPPPCGR